MNRKDLILALTLLAAAGVMALVLFVIRHVSDGDAAPAAAAVTVRVDGELRAVWDLVSAHEEDIETEYGHNHISVDHGAVRMTEADCPDRICIHQGEITGPGELIVCLPHHLVVEIVAGGTSRDSGRGEDPAGDDAGIDAVTG